ncbi:hypothetical protein BDR05DRAFT_953499 [Suillus weaverae]|nr:hypothetical protein BDR05DRAFT_953499 [Suillus weaverae]
MPVSTITVASTCFELYKPYQTRNNSALQATSRTSVKSTGSVQKFNSTPKPLTPVLQLSKTESAADRKTSSTSLQEAQEAHKASVNIITENPSPSPLYDDLADDDANNEDDDNSQQFHHYHQLNSNGQKVLKEITKLPPVTGHIMISKNSTVLTSLLVEMPSAIVIYQIPALLPLSKSHPVTPDL